MNSSILGFLRIIFPSRSPIRNIPANCCIIGAWCEPKLEQPRMVPTKLAMERWIPKTQVILTMKYHQRHHEALKEWILIILMHSRIDSSIWNTMFRAASHCTIMKETFRKTLNFPRKRLNFLRASQVYVQITPCIKSRLKEWVKIYVERDPIVISTVNNNRNNNRIVRVVYAK